MIILTALSYYYTGLQPQDVQHCILALRTSTDASKEFFRWVAKSKLPPNYRKVESLNLDDSSCLETLYKHLRRNKATINFFLKQKVFHKIGREFTWKLSSSAWDLCETESGKITTGFSGTCDSRIPSTMKQKDFPELEQSTASALATLLRHDNRQYLCASSSTGQRLSTDALLDLIVSDKHERSVIIDVGAHFLESNKEIASRWLGKCNTKLAAVFFSDNDEKMVINRDGTIQKFNSSMFKDEIGSCLIYLDEFHTRGTDFQFPDTFAAAVLLGPRLAKDSLVQACMRMRKLAVSQTIVFIAPPEVDHSIRAVTGNPSGVINSSHVIRWANNQSCKNRKQQNALCTIKGITQSRRRIVGAGHILDTGQVLNSETYLQTIRERECRPVKELYRANTKTQMELPFALSMEEQGDEIMADLLVEWDRTNVVDLEGTGISEEQEREVLHEVEEEREVQRPNGAIPANPQASAFLQDLISDGVLPASMPEELLPAFEVLNATSLAALYCQNSWPGQILVTKDFVRTINNRGNCDQDGFLRPVQWVLHAKRMKHPIVISPHEANEFLPKIRQSKRVTLFLYQAKVSKGMLSFDNLDVYKIPEEDNGVTISREQMAILNLFAGQLYFSTFEDYQLLCTLIGLWDGERPLPIRRKVERDNWVPTACRKANGWNECTFTESPVLALKAFISMRRLGEDWEETHMCDILSGKILRRDEFEDTETDSDSFHTAEMKVPSVADVDGTA